MSLQVKFQNLKLGILGGGQLGLMLCQAAISYGIELFILDPDKDAPCSSYCKNFSCGSLTDEETVYAFGSGLDILTIEIENVNVSALKRLETKGVKVFPQAEVIALIQDKGLQKQFFSDHDIPSAPFVRIENRNELYEYLNMLPGVMKSRKAGYDGKGVVTINHRNEIGKGFNVPSILERKVNFIKEISVLVSRNALGEIEVYDAVEMEFNPDANLVEFLLAPARISFAVETSAKSLAVRIINELKMVGILAVEMFMTADGTLLVNELAPRPHNSGHHTIEAAFISQYEQHLRAILGLPLGSTKMRSQSVMVNLLGEPGHHGPACYEGIEDILDIEGVFIHLYGKKLTKPMRKMGHVTIIDEDLNSAYQKAHFIKETLKVKT